MPIDWRNIEMPLGGVDQYTDAPHVLSGKLREAENVRWRTPPALNKRYGSTPMPVTAVDVDGTAHTLSSAEKLIGYKESTLQCTDDRLFVYSELQSQWAARGYLSPCHVDRFPVQADLLASDNWDSAYNQGIIVYASNTNVGGSATTSPINAIVINAATGAIIAKQIDIFFNVGTAYAHEVRVVAVGDYIYIVAGRFYSRIDVTSGNYTFPAGVAFTGVSNFANPGILAPDVSAIGSTELVLIGLDQATGFVYFYRVSVATNTAVAMLPSTRAASKTLAILGVDNEGIMALYDDGAGTLYALRSSDTFVGFVEYSIPTANCDGWATIARTSATERIATWRTPGATGLSAHNGGMQYCILDQSASTATVVDVFDIYPASKLFSRGSSAYGWFSYHDLGGVLAGLGGNEVVPTGGDDETLLLLELKSLVASPYLAYRWAATAARGIAEGSIGTQSFLPAAYEVSTDTYECAAQIKTKFNFAGTDDITIRVSRTTTNRLRADFSPAGKHSYARWGDGIMFAGGLPCWYDGILCEPLGFAWRPGAVKWLEGGPVGGGLAAGLYNVGACYEKQDALGYIHRSSPSQQLELDVVGPNAIINTRVQETLLKSLSSGYPGGSLVQNARLLTYRTVKGGPALYDVGIGYGDDFGLAAIRDTVDGEYQADNVIDKNAYLYTTGNIVENAGPPPCKLIEYFQSRLWLAGLEEPNAVWFSQPFVAGEGPRFNETFALRMAFPVATLANMETQLVVFGEDDIQVIVGNGPPATGGLDIGFRIIDVPSDVGCIAPKSVVVYRDGVLFLSRKGLYRLGRDHTVSHVGLPAKGYLDAYPAIISATVMPERSEVIWTVSGPDSSARLVWNYEVDAWSLDKLAAAVIPVSTATVYDTATGGPVYAALSTEGTVYKEDPNVWWDGEFSTADKLYYLRFVTPWVKRNTLQDWLLMRGCALLCKSRGNHGIQVRVGYDYDEATWSLPYTWTPAQIAALFEEQLYIDFERQDCKSVRLEITETIADDGRGLGFYDATEGPEVISLVFEGGFMAQGRTRTPAAQRR